VGSALDLSQRDSLGVQPMSWLITGGCGFVGTNLADELLSRGEAVVIFDNLSRFGSEINLNWLRSRHGSDWQLIQGDVRDAPALTKTVAEVRPSAVAHLAGQVAATTSLANPRMDFEINALGALNILEAVRLNHPEAVILFSSTNKVYGSLESFEYRETPTRYEAVAHETGFDESLQLDGSTPYGCSKLAADTYFRDYKRVYGIRTMVFRHSSMYGGRQFATFDQGWIGWFCQKALEMQDPNTPPISISGDGKQVRDLLFASDLVNCYISAYKHVDSCAGEAFNIGGGIENSLSLRELFKELELLTNAEIRFTQGDWRVADQKVFVADFRKASLYFDWRPMTSYKTGLAKMMEWSRRGA